MVGFAWRALQKKGGRTVAKVSPADAQRVLDSEHGQLATVDAMRVLVGVINRGAHDVPLQDVRARQALNLGVDRDRLIREGFAGYASPLAGLAPRMPRACPRASGPIRTTLNRRGSSCQRRVGPPVGPCGWRPRRKWKLLPGCWRPICSPR